MHRKLLYYGERNMRTETHWIEAKSTKSFYEANHFVLTLKELAKTKGYDPNGIKIFTKDRIIDGNYGRANSMVSWKEGPDNWAYDMIIESESCVPYNDKTIIFYDT